MTKPDIYEKVKDAIDRFEAMTPEEQAAHRAEQAKSFERGMAPCEHGVFDWEYCPECRELADKTQK